MSDEGRLLAKLSHPNILAVYDEGTFAGRRFFAFEYLEGKTLRELLDESRPTATAFRANLAGIRHLTSRIDQSPDSAVASCRIPSAIRPSPERESPWHWQRRRFQ